MILIEKPSWFRVLFMFKGSSIARTWKRVLTSFGFSLLVTFLYEFEHVFDRDLTVVPFSLIGLALGIFLGFRNNTSYDRFWEGRKLWGQVVNSSRNLARLTLTILGPHDANLKIRERHQEIVYRIIAYVHALRQHLRDQHRPEELENLLPQSEIQALLREKNRPVAIIQGISDRLRHDLDHDWVHPFHLPILEKELNTLINCQGGCERIKNTPIPFSYNVLLHRLVAVYCFGLPFGLVPSIGILTPVIVLLVAYAFFGLDAVGDEIEDPFGEDPNDLPLGQITNTIEINLRQLLKEDDSKLPPPPKVINNVIL